MTSKDPKSICLAYLEAFGKKDFGKLEQLLAPELQFKGPATARSGAQSHIGVLKRLGSVLLRNEVKRVFVDGSEVCVIYDFVTDTPMGAAPIVEWLRVEDGRIQSVWLLFDRQPWPAVMEEVSRRTGPAPELHSRSTPG
jgi:hypothetical protein